MRENLIGNKYNMLTVIGWVGAIKNSHNQTRDMWLCQCDCGKYKTLDTYILKGNRQKSCGCISHVHKLNTYKLNDDYGMGWDSNGNIFYFDIDDYDLIKDYTWSKHVNTGYFRSSYFDKNKKSHDLLMHRLIMGVANLNNKKLLIDHKNGIRYDNRKDNLRFASYSENMSNSDVSSRNTSGTRGVSYDTHNGKWRSVINYQGKRYFLGSYSNKEDAICARKEAEKKYYKEFSYDSSQNINT